MQPLQSPPPSVMEQGQQAVTFLNTKSYPAFGFPADDAISSNAGQLKLKFDSLIEKNEAVC